MVKEENLSKIYNGVIDGEELTTKALNNYGFNSKEITNLISDRIIERVKRGYYQFLDVDKLFFYGKTLISKKEYDRANICFQKCYELNPQHGGAAFQLFIRAIQNKDYKKALEYFEIIYQTDNEFYIQDSNYYLSLLSNIIELPEKYREFAKYLKIEDIEVKNNDKRYFNKEQQNNIRNLSLNQSFNTALIRLNNLGKKKKIKVQEFLIKILLSQAKEKHYEIKMKMLSLVRDKKYDALLELINKITIYRHLSYVEELMYGLLSDLYRIKGSKKLPERKEIITDSFTIALQNRNYELAYQIAQNHNNQSNPVYYLLCDIIDEIENIKKQYQTIKKIPVEVLETTSKESIKLKQEEILSEDNKEHIDIIKV